eukprot:6072165-Amphidinium_carterae.1
MFSGLKTSGTVAIATVDTGKVSHKYVVNSLLSTSRWTPSFCASCAVPSCSLGGWNFASCHHCTTVVIKGCDAALSIRCLLTAKQSTLGVCCRCMASSRCQWLRVNQSE